MVGVQVFHVGLGVLRQTRVLARFIQVFVLAQKAHQPRRVEFAGDAALLVQNQRREDVVLVRAAAVVGAALDLAVVEHAVGQIVDVAVGQKLEGQRVIDDGDAALVRVDALQADVAQQQRVRVDVQKAPVFLGGQAALPDWPLDGDGLAGALPIIAAVVTAANVFVLDVGVQHVDLLLQLVVVGVEVVAVQITDVLALGLVEQPSTDGVHPLDALVGLIFCAGDAIHHKNTHGIGIFFFPDAQLFDRPIVGAVVRAEDFDREIRLLCKYGLHRLVDIGCQIVKRDQHADLGLVHGGYLFFIVLWQIL